MLANHLKKLSKSLKRHTEASKAPVRLLDEVRKLNDLLLEQEVNAFRSAHPDPLARFGRKCFSQGDEGGITLEMLRRIGLLERGAAKAATYAEFGVGDGTENNTLILASLGWWGFWAGGQKLAFEHRPGARFCFFNEWITREKIVGIAQRGLSHLGSPGLDVVSIDVDGNDYYFAEALLRANARPRLFIVEYNAKFPLRRASRCPTAPIMSGTAAISSVPRCNR